MTDKEFCELYTQFYEDKLDNIKQLTLISFNGEELKEFVDFCIEQSKLTTDDVSEQVCGCCKKQLTAGVFPKWFCLRIECEMYLKPQTLH